MRAQTTKKWTKHLVIGLCTVALAMGCGDDERGSRDGGRDGGSNGTTDDGGGNDSGGGSENANESSFDVSLEKEGGEKTEVSERQPNSEASEETWGAIIAENRLQITLVGDTFALTAIVETLPSAEAPGRFAVGAPPEGTFVTKVDAMAQNSFSSNGQGHIRLTNCPKAPGQKVTGSFENVILFADMGSGQQTLNGSFDVVVYAAVGELHCQEEVPDTNNNNNNNNTGGGGQCVDFEFCEDGGVCCPFIDCIADCEFNCFLTEPGCSFGMNPQACSVCLDGCLDECNVSSSCRSELFHLDQCDETHGCYDTNDEEEGDACMLENCCSELRAAF